MLPDGSTVRRVALGCSSCAWVSAHMCGVHLRDGERLFVHGQGGVGAQGAYEASGLPLLAGGTLATPPLPGTVLVVELHTPARLAGVPLHLQVCGATAGTSAAFGAAAFAARNAMSAAAPVPAVPLAALGDSAQQSGYLGGTGAIEPPADTAGSAAFATASRVRQDADAARGTARAVLELPGLRVVLRPPSSHPAASTPGRSLSPSLASSPLAPAVGAGGACMVDVGCHPAWSDVSRGVVALLLDGGLCTGSLLNARSTPPSAGPLLLTGYHCVRHIVEQRVADGWTHGAVGSFIPVTVIYNWRSPGCAHPQPPEPRGAGLQATYGASLVAYANDSDTALLRLAAPPPPSFRARLNGWSAASAPPRQVATIHHPSGDLQKLAVSWSPPSLSLFCPGCCTAHGGRVVPTQRCWRHVEWLVRRYDVGSSSHGSSGAPLFDEEGLVVGQMHGGYATCAHPRDDYFGTLAAAYNNSLRYEQPLDASRLWPHLDPTGALRMAGAEASEEGSPDATIPAGLRLWSAAYAPGHVLRLRRGAWLAAPLRLALTRRPTAPVTVRLLVRGEGAADVTVEPGEVTFSASEWYVPATISFRAARGNGGRGGEGGDGGSNSVSGPPLVLWLDVASTDDGYDGVTPPPLAVELLSREAEPGPLCTAGGWDEGGGDGGGVGGGGDGGARTPGAAITRLGLSSPAVLAIGGDGMLFRELSEPDGCPSPTEVATLPAGVRAADASSPPEWVAAALLPAGRYGLLDGAWHRVLDPAAACDALWRATAAHTLSCGDTLQWPAAPTAWSAAAMPRWVAEAGGPAGDASGGGARAAGAEGGPGSAADGPVVLDVDGDGRPELLFRLFIAPNVSSFSVDTCGSDSDGRIRLFAGCPWGATALARLVLEDGDAGTVERCRTPLPESTVAAARRRLARGNDAVVWSARVQRAAGGEMAAPSSSPSGEYWLAVDSDAEQADLASGGRLRVICARDEAHAALPGGSVADPCSATSGGCAHCTALTACGWCSGPGEEGVCLAGRAEGPLLSVCKGAWVPFADRCASGAFSDVVFSAPLRFSVVSAEAGGGDFQRGVSLAAAAAAVLVLALPVSLLVLGVRRQALRRVGARNPPMI